MHLTNRGFLIWRTNLQLKRPSRLIGNPSSGFCLLSPVSCPTRPSCPACHEFMSRLCKTNPILQTTKLPQHLMPHRFTAISLSAPPQKTKPIKPNSPPAKPLNPASSAFYLLCALWFVHILIKLCQSVTTQLPNPLARQPEFLPYLFERHRPRAPEAVMQPQDLCLSRFNCIKQS